MNKSTLAFLALGLGTVVVLAARGARAASPDVPAPNSDVYERGIASWYGPGLQGNKTANGETFDMNQMTCAHKRLPFNTMVEVTDVDTGRKCVVRVNDRGPFVAGRIIDLSRAAAVALGIIGDVDKGLANVELRLVS